MTISLKNLKKWGLFVLLSAFFLPESLQSQIEGWQPDVLENIAEVYQGKEASNYFAIPEIKYDPCSDDDFLQIDFHVKYAWYKIGDDSVRMRSYVYDDIPEGMGQLTEGPTIRIQRNDRFSVAIHNELPLNGDRNYMGSMDKQWASQLNTGELDSLTKLAMVNASYYRHDRCTPPNFYNPVITGDTCGRANDFWIKPENLEFAGMKVVEEGSLWTVFGHSRCECAPEERGTCAKDTIFYDVERLWNPGTQTEALRIYSTHEHDEENHNEPHGFNVTNFHTHGFHVSPFQDDIFRRLDPGFSTYYNYDLKDHTPGTMWYHPHIHGSTALQVGSGMSGVIIIEDDPAVLASFPRLRDASHPDREKVMVFNQLMYDRETGELPDFNTMVSRVRKPPSRTTINGVVKPIIDMQPGEVQRWRMLHSGYSTNLALYFGDRLDVKQIAVDGIMFKEVRDIGSTHLSPGNRTDILIKISDESKGIPRELIPIYSLDYLPECEYFPESEQCTTMDAPSEDKIIAYVRVGRKPMIPAMTFPTRLPGPGIGHADILPEQLVNSPEDPRSTVFDITAGEYRVNQKVFDADVINEKPLLGTREAWKFEATNFEHPFHIHINPFQVVQFGGVELNTPIWKDVALVRQPPPYSSWGNTVEVMQGGETQNLVDGSALAYTYYQKFWGGFVLHCHILDHEDRGMMQRVNIVNDIEDSDLTPAQKRKARRQLGIKKK